MPKYFFKKKIDIDSLIKKAEVKTTEFADFLKIKIEIYSLKKHRDEMLFDLGKSLYKMYKKRNFDQKIIDNICKSVYEIEEQIKLKEKGVYKENSSIDKIIKESFNEKKYRHHKDLTYKKLIEAEDYEIQPIK